MLPGSIAYSAVSQPIDLPSRNGGTVSDRLAVTVPPSRPSDKAHCRDCYARTPARSNGPKLVVRAIKRSVHGTPILDVSSRQQAASGGLWLDQEPDQKCHLEMEPVGCLVNDLAARAVEDLGGHLFAAMGGKAVKKDRVGAGVVPAGRR